MLQGWLGVRYYTLGSQILLTPKARPHPLLLTRLEDWGQDLGYDPGKHQAWSDLAERLGQTGCAHCWGGADECCLKKQNNNLRL
jgi:hypothetical protein